MHNNQFANKFTQIAFFNSMSLSLETKDDQARETQATQIEVRLRQC